jgi:hypothetical protein
MADDPGESGDPSQSWAGTRHHEDRRSRLTAPFSESPSATARGAADVDAGPVFAARRASRSTGWRTCPCAEGRPAAPSRRPTTPAARRPTRSWRFVKTGEALSAAATKMRARSRRWLHIGLRGRADCRSPRRGGRPGSGSSQATSPTRLGCGRSGSSGPSLCGRRLADRNASRQRLVATRYSQVRSEGRRSKRASPWQAASNVSCRASSTEPRIR